MIDGRMRRGLLALALGLVAPGAALATVPTAFVPSSTGSVSVVDTGTNSVTTTIPVGSGPIGVAVNRSGSQVYVTEEFSNAVAVISGATDTVTATIGVGGYPQYIALSPDGASLVVSNFGDGTASIIDTANNTVTATVTVGGNPQGVVFSPDGSKAYVANAHGFVSVITLASQTVTATFTGLATGRDGPHGLVISPDGKTLYVVDGEYQNVLYVLATASGATTTIPISTTPVAVAIAPNGARLYVSNLDSIEVFSTATDALVDTITLSQVGGLSFTPDGATLYALHNLGASSFLTPIDAGTDTVGTDIPLGNGAQALGQFINAPPPPVPPPPVPALSGWAVGLLASLMAGAGLWGMRRLGA